MTPNRRIAVLAMSIAALALPLSVAISPDADAASYSYKNCAKLHKDFKHGVGKKNAKDHVSGSSSPVKNFKRSTKIYKKVISHNAGLDRDHDGIACEAH